MEDFLKIKLVPSLLHITAAKICIVHYIERIGCYTDNRVTWNVTKDSVRQSISSLNFPESLKIIILNFVDDIGHELLKWMKMNDWLKHRPDYFDREGTFPLALHDYITNCFVWSSRGTIQYEKTARNILRSEYITLKEKFHLACAYCFSDILSYWFVSDLRKYKSVDTSELSKQPFVYYWVCRFFPEMTSAFKQDMDEIAQDRRHMFSQGDNIDKRMLLIFFNKMNCVAAKHLYDRIDLIAKEEVIRNLLLAFDFDMKTHFISQISFGTREKMLKQPSDLLSSLTNILWQDYVYFCFNTYEAFITSLECLEFLKKVFHFIFPRCEYIFQDNLRPLQINKDVPQCEWKKTFVHEFWNYLSENFRQNVVTECLSPSPAIYRSPLVFKESRRLPKSPIFQILSILVDFNKDTNSPYYLCSGRLIGEILRIAESETAHLEVSNSVPSYLNHFNTDNEMFGFLLYYPKINRHRHTFTITRASFLRNKKLYLVHDFLSWKFPNTWNPLKNEHLHDTIIDVFVEYCRSGEVNNIDKILNSHFENPCERVAYKSSLLWCTFNKLIAKAVNESNYYLKDESYNPCPTNVAPRLIREHMVHHERLIPPRYLRFMELHRDRFLGTAPVDRVSTRIPVIYNSDDSDMIFSAVDSFLKWYFDIEVEVCEFKTVALYSGHVPIIEELLKQKKFFKLKKLLSWFLSYEEDRLNAFKNECPRSELTSLL